MFLVIFGAGASFDSVPERFWSLEMVSNRDLRPPLAVQLFEPRGYYVDRIGSFPYCPEIVAELRGAIVAGRNIEDEIERFVLWGEGGHERAQRQVMALRFYLQAIITGCRTWGSMARSATNYAALFSRIERWREPRNEPVQVVTFNYDLLLEDALRTFRDDFDAIHRYPDGDKYNVYKLHGSTNWEHLVRLSRDYGHPAQLIEDAPVLEISQDIVVEGQVEDMAAIPAIAGPDDYQGRLRVSRSSRKATTGDVVERGSRALGGLEGAGANLPRAAS